MNSENTHPVVNVEVNVLVPIDDGYEPLGAPGELSARMQHGVDLYRGVGVLEEATQVEQDGHNVDDADGFHRVGHRADLSRLHRVAHVNIPETQRTQTIDQPVASRSTGIAPAVNHMECYTGNVKYCTHLSIVNHMAKW